MRLLPEEIDIYVFSGTGNTLLAALALADELSAAGKRTRLWPIERSDPAKIDIRRGLGLAFPVAAFSTYPLVWRFIDRLPPGGGTAAFMLDTLAGFSGGIVGPLRRILTCKGYTPLGAIEIIMPGNFLRMDPAEKARAKIVRGQVAARQFAHALLAGEAKWPRIPLAADALYLLSRCITSLWRTRLSQRLLAMRIDPAKCQKCGLCRRLCPTSAIAVPEKYEVDTTCEYCQRCAAVCPADAIRCGRSATVYRAIKAEDYL